MSNDKAQMTNQIQNLNIKFPLTFTPMSIGVFARGEGIIK